MRDISSRAFSLLLGLLLCIQLIAGLWHIGYPFTDGRYHYNWGPPFWLLHAKATNDVGLVAARFGVEGYASHPELIGPVIAIWTRIAGYSEVSIRAFSLALTIMATLILSLAMRLWIGNRRAIAFCAVFASLPLVYILGRKLDQEALVLVFLALFLYGSALMQSRERAGIVVVFFGALGMALSDWSGLVLTASLSVAAWFVWADRAVVKKYIYSALGGLLLGLALYVLQSYLQVNASSPGVYLDTFARLWKYRAGTADIGILEWLSRQAEYLSKNYTFPLVFAALWGLISNVRKNDTKHLEAFRILCLFSIAIGLGDILYLLAVPEASYIHIYFQYYLCIPVAVGVVFALENLSQRIHNFNKIRIWSILLVSLVVCSASWSAYQFHVLLFEKSFGNPSDVELLRTIRNIPPTKTIVALDIQSTALSWYANPNIEYYAGREIRGYKADDVPVADYQLMRRPFASQIVEQVNAGAAGKEISASIFRCSDNFCIVQLTRGTKKVR